MYLAFALGRELFSPWAGVVAALVVLTRPAMERDALLAYQDVPFAALVVGAVLLEARARRRTTLTPSASSGTGGTPVLALLAVAGLLRPEAWVLAGLYALWLWPRRDARGRVLALALAALAPVIWAASDWAVTGDPLHSLHGTADLAIANDRRRTLADVPYWTAQYFGYALREPLVLGVPIGLAFAWFHARRQAVLPLAVVVAMVAVFADRADLRPAADPPLRRHARRAADAVLRAGRRGLGDAPARPRAHGLDGRRRRCPCCCRSPTCRGTATCWRPSSAGTTSGGVLYGDLQQAMEAPQVRAAFAACPDLTAGDHRPMPYARFWLDGAPGSVSTVEGDASPMGELLLMPVKGPDDAPHLPAEDLPEGRDPRGLHGRSTRTGRGA